MSNGVGAGVALEIAEGVESMQVLYGEDRTVGAADDDVLLPTAYVPINAVVAPINIRTVKISLLMRTVNPLPQLNPSVNNFDLFGWAAGNTTTITNANDARARRVFTTTVFLRNQGVADRQVFGG